MQAIKIMIAGLPLAVRARVAAGLKGASVDTAPNAEILRTKLSLNPFQALVIGEGILSGTSRRPPQGGGVDDSLVPFLESLRSQFSGPVIFCATRQHTEGELWKIVRSGRVSVILQQPVEPLALIRSLALELGLAVDPAHLHEGATFEEQAILEKLWGQHHSELIAAVAELEQEATPTLTAPQLEQGWRAAHALAANLGAFGLIGGTLLAREAEALFRRALAGEPWLAERLLRLLEPLRVGLEQHRWEQLTTWLNGTFIVVGEEPGFLEGLCFEALLSHWGTVVCGDLSRLTDLIGEHSACCVVLDLSCRACATNHELLGQLLETEDFPLVALYPPQQQPGPQGQRPHQVWLAQPAAPYTVLMAVMRSQLQQGLREPSNILVLDQDRVTLDLVCETLGLLDYYVQAQEGSFKFWDTLESRRPDLVILDLDLRPLGGLELCKAMRADTRYTSLPVLLLSGYNDAETLQRAFEAGVDDYLCKPFTSRELGVRVSNRLARTRESYQQRSSALDKGQRTSLGQLLLRSLRSQVPATVVCLDPTAGGQPIRHTVELLTQNLRSDDVVKVLSPTRLLVGLYGARQSQAGRRLEELLRRLGQKQRLGMAEFPRDSRDPTALIAVAESSMQEGPGQCSGSGSQSQTPLEPAEGGLRTERRRGAGDSPHEPLEDAPPAK